MYAFNLTARLVFRPIFAFLTHMLHKSSWAERYFTCKFVKWGADMVGTYESGRCDRLSGNVALERAAEWIH